MSQFFFFFFFVSVLGLISALPISVRPPSSQKFVFAHHIIGNTYNFTSATWSSDVTLAHASGIDGFALNIGGESWEPNQVKSAYDAAQKSNTGFKMFLSLDMSSLPCASVSDAQNLVSLVRSQAMHPSQLRYGPENKVLVSTFSGEECTFSSTSPSEGWAQHFIAPLKSDIYFIPSFFVDPSQLTLGDAQGKGGFGGIIDGDFNWNSGWPIQITTAALAKSASDPSALASLLDLNASSITPSTTSVSTKRSLSLSLEGLSSAFKTPADISNDARDALANAVGTFTSDEEHLNAIQGGTGHAGVANVAGTSVGALPSKRKTYMAAVSPWFSTHYSKQTFDKNFIYFSDSHLYPKRWENLVNSRDKVDLVEIISWNDYGESHYIGPIEGIQPNSQAWVNGNSHTGWLDITAYYARAFKTGVYPTITKDKVVMWARTHPRDAEASEDTVGRPTNFQLTEDSLWTTVLVPEPSTITLTTSNSSAVPAAQIFQVPAGVTHLKAPLTPGGSMRASISRAGKTVLNFAPEDYRFNPHPTSFNFNAFVAASP